MRGRELALHCTALSTDLGYYLPMPFFYPPKSFISFDNAYITWINEVRSWTLYSQALISDSAVEINKRLIPVEPMVNHKNRSPLLPY